MSERLDHNTENGQKSVWQELVRHCPVLQVALNDCEPFKKLHRYL